MGDLNLIPGESSPLSPRGRKKRLRNLFTKIQAPGRGRCPVPSPYCFTHTDLLFLKKNKNKIKVRVQWGATTAWTIAINPWGSRLGKKVGKPQCTSPDIAKEDSTHSQGGQLGSGGAWAQTEVGHGLCTPNTRSEGTDISQQSRITFSCPPAAAAGQVGSGPVAPEVSAADAAAAW